MYEKFGLKSTERRFVGLEVFDYIPHYNTLPSYKFMRDHYESLGEVMGLDRLEDKDFEDIIDK